MRNEFYWSKVTFRRILWYVDSDEVIFVGLVILRIPTNVAMANLFPMRHTIFEAQIFVGF